MAIEYIESEEQLVNNSNYTDAHTIDEHSINPVVIHILNKYSSSSDAINRFEHFLSFGSLDGMAELNCNNDNLEQVKNECNALRSFLDVRQLPCQMILYRGTSINSFCRSIIMEQADTEIFLSDCISLSDRELNNKYNLQIFTYGQFMSTSISYDTACDFIKYPNPCILRICAPKETAGQCMDDFSEWPEEQEVLLTSNTKFQFVKFCTIADTKTIWITVLPRQNEGNSSTTSNSLHM